MNGYTKLFNSILFSTIWQEPNETRILWITMLAMCDKNGEVMASVPGLAKTAGITIDSCRAGLETLMSPDPDSRTKDHEGRRIKEIEGGWELLNHSKYRELLSADERREYNRRKQAEWREKHPPGKSKSVNDKSITVNHSHSQSALSAHTDTDTDTEASNTPKPPRGRRDKIPSDDPIMNSLWESYPRKVNKPAGLKAIAKALPKASPEIITAGMERWKAHWKREGTEEQFIPHPAKWFNGEQWNDPVPAGNGSSGSQSPYRTSGFAMPVVDYSLIPDRPEPIREPEPENFNTDELF